MPINGNSRSIHYDRLKKAADGISSVEAVARSALEFQVAAGLALSFISRGLT
ncbi:hypothetical protein [Mesorhizobium sp. M1A.T.Ca.IN.004.03.1.1]|uniref:hypothetical protein n=1 Tax=Mesorhizobium sp. M1A.T.Ca.IN.004.03.1.1 TaxID=2496795 RepID=UPI0013E32334|nr:hypothetical protein [Mesorhizobium sp. M1A.T.Ca.IN.004.03.1.1]